MSGNGGEVEVKGVKDILKDEELISNLEEELKKLREEIRKLIEENKRLKLENADLKEEVRRLKIENKQLILEIEALRKPPLVVGDIEEVIDNNRAIVRSTTGPKFLVYVSQFLDRSKLLPGTRVAMTQSNLTIVDVLPSSKDPLVRAAEVIERPDVTYDDIGGLKDAIREIRESIELPMTNPELFEKLGIDPPKGVLLIGPPGTGKTLLAKAVAHHTNATFIHIVGSELVQKYIGEGARLVRELFQLAREKSPAIIFIDEIDAIGAKRSLDDTSASREVERTLMQLLAEMDGFDPRGDVKIIAATNRPDILDPALLRPGRFDRIIRIPMPDKKAREEIFRIHTRRMRLNKDVSFEDLARMTEGMSGADIKAICTEAGMFAIREGRDYVVMDDFLKAIKKVKEMQKGPIEEGLHYKSTPGSLFR